MEINIEATEVCLWPDAQRGDRFVCRVRLLSSSGSHMQPWEETADDRYAQINVPVAAIDGPVEWMMGYINDHFEDTDPHYEKPGEKDEAAIEETARKCTRDFIAQLKTVLTGMDKAVKNG